MGNVVDLNNQPVETGREIAVSVEQVTKVYKLYGRNRDRMKEALGLTRKKLHREHFALNGVDMKIYQGETVGIIGTNGSGKSTLLKIITGVLNPTGGHVTVNGRISALLELGAGFNMEYTGIENIYLNGTMMGFSNAEIEERMQGILEFADIGDFVNQPVKTYSSGMFVRLAFAVAINIDPEILIVDEALSVGDVFFQSKCYHKFEEFKKMGKTILFVSHDLSSIAKYCDRVVLIDKGVKLGEGSPRQMIDDYKRVLVGQYEMNEEKAEESVSAGENPELLEYGTKQAQITEYYITDDQGKRATAVIKGTEFQIHMRADFYEDLPAPIFAFSFKNIKGTEITGTNTMFEKSFLEPVKAGDTKDVIFTQKMSLQGGEYLLSLGLTGYEKDNFQVYHRLYDVLNVTVVSDKNTVGFYDMDSVVTVIGEESISRAGKSG
jgi:teichoic acid transport system ATP-binding protein